MNDIESSKNKKIRILEAASRVLTKRGLQYFSFESIATEAGLSRQLVRHYFLDTETLISDLCDHLTNDYQNVLVSGVVDVGKIERLDFFLDFFFGTSRDHPMPDNLEAYDALFAYAVGSPKVKTRLRAKYEILAQVMKHELAIAHPELENHACAELSFLFVSMMHAHWSYVATLGYSAEHNKLTRRTFERLIQSYLGETPFMPSLAKPWLHSS